MLWITKNNEKLRPCMLRACSRRVGARVWSRWREGWRGGNWQKLHHFISVARWDPAELEAVLLRRANDLLGGDDAFLIFDDTALRKKGKHSVGVAHQYCGESGKLDNCQCLVSMTLARHDVPACIGLRLFLPESWAGDAQRRAKCGVPDSERHRSKWRIALEELDRALAGGVRFGCVLADGGYGAAQGFRRGLSERGLHYAVGIAPQQKVYPEDVELTAPTPQTGGRPQKHPVPSAQPVSAREYIEGLGPKAFGRITWRHGTKGPLRARFTSVRIRMADGAKAAQGLRLPGERLWLVCEWRYSGERKYYVSNFPPETKRRELVRAIKSRWSCEQPHQQMKQELGLDHFEGRSWLGLRHHCILSMVAFCFLQSLRLGGKKGAQASHRRSR